MKVSESYYDELFPFLGQWDMESLCGLKIRTVDDKTYVIVTELYQENPGSSVTYTGEYLKQQICKAKGLDPDKIVYLECNPNTNSKLSFYDEEFFEVNFYAEPQNRYRRLSADEVKHIVG